jgi:hypothetical protein
MIAAFLMIYAYGPGKLSAERLIVKLNNKKPLM